MLDLSSLRIKQCRGRHGCEKEGVMKKELKNNFSLKSKKKKLERSASAPKLDVLIKKKCTRVVYIAKEEPMFEGIQS